MSPRTVEALVVVALSLVWLRALAYVQRNAWRLRRRRALAFFRKLGPWPSSVLAVSELPPEPAPSWRCTFLGCWYPNDPPHTHPGDFTDFLEPIPTCEEHGEPKCVLCIPDAGKPRC